MDEDKELENKKLENMRLEDKESEYSELKNKELENTESEYEESENEEFEERELNSRPLRRPIRQRVEMPQKKERIKKWVAVCLIIMALCLDIAEIAISWIGFVVVGEILNILIWIIATITFFIIFQIIGVNRSSNVKNIGTDTVSKYGQKFILQLSTVFIEILPVDFTFILSFVWTIGIILTIVMTWQEDRGENPSVISAINEALNYSSMLSTFGSGFIGNKKLKKMRAPNQ